MGPTVEFLTPEKSINGGSNKWTPEFKARLVSETLRPGARVVDVVQRYGVQASVFIMPQLPPAGPETGRRTLPWPRIAR